MITGKSMDRAENALDITKRQYLHEMQRSETTPIPKDQLLDEREAHIEYQKSKKKVLYKDNYWRTEKKRFSDKMEEFWKGKTVYKIKKDYVIPDDVVRSDIDRQAKLFRGNIDEGFQTWFFTFTSCPGLRSLSGKIFREVTLLRKHLLP